MRETRGTLLIVDDDPVIRASMYQCLSEIGYSVRTAEDGLEALLELDKEAPEVLLTDLNMPRMSGFDLLAQVHRRFPEVQTIAMSSTFYGDEVPSGVLADAFFQKGSSIGALLRTIDNLPSHSQQNVSYETKSGPFWIKRDTLNRMFPSSPRSSWPTR
jgi:DNA-binding NtrC family response regulator